MSKISELSASKRAAEADLKRLEADATATESELRKAKRLVRQLHDQWLDAALDALDGGFLRGTTG